MEQVVVQPNILMTRKKDQELRLYFFVGTKERVSGIPAFLDLLPSEQKVIYVLGFELQEAFELAKEKNPQWNLLYTRQSPTVREFLHELALESIAYEQLSKPIVREEPKAKVEPINLHLTPHQLSFEQFKASLLFAANESGMIYAKPEHQQILKEIIEGLKYEPELRSGTEKQ